jgi:hypothetical protein
VQQLAAQSTSQVVRQCTLQNPPDIISYFNRMLLPHPQKKVLQNERWFLKEYFHDTPAFTHSHTAAVRSHFVDAMKLFVERLLQIGRTVWRGLS